MTTLHEQGKEGLMQPLWERGSTIVIAVSGGPDSMALMHMLAERAKEDSLSLIVAHVNHGFRLAESQNEYELVKQEAKKLGLPFEYVELHMPLYLQQHQVNSQSASRSRRYQFLYEVCHQYEAAYLAVAHHRDDQAETVLMHILRGTGINGLSGMSNNRIEKNVELIRPLLRMNKDSLIFYCKEHHIPYLMDSSNEKRDYFRNEVRLDVIPYLEQFNPKISDSLARLADVAGEENDWMEQQTKQIFAQYVKLQNQQLIISCKTLRNLHVALQRRVIKLILSYLSQEATNISFEGIERIRWAAGETAASTYRLDVGEGIVCVREYEDLRFVHINHFSASNFSDAAQLSIEQDQLPCELKYGNWIIVAQLFEGDADIPQPSSRYEAVFDYNEVSFPLVIRSRKNGDRMSVLGLNGTKKVQDMFVDAKVPASERATYPIVQDHSNLILWIPGVRRSQYGLVDSKTTSCLMISCRKDNNNA